MDENNDKNSATRDSLLSDDGTYAVRGGQGRLVGFHDQLKVLMLFMVRGIRQNLEFSLVTEMEAARSFDDLLLRYKSDADTDVKAYFVQVKHSQDKSRKINVADLFDTASDFALKKYFDSYCQMKSDPIFDKDELKDFIIYTNIDLVEKNFELQEIKLIADNQFDEFLDTETNEIKSKRYRLSNIGPSKVYENLASEAYNLAQILVKKVLNSEKLSNEIAIIEKYRIALTREVINVNEERISDDFIEGKGLSDGAENFRNEFYSQLLLQMGLQKDYAYPERVWNEIRSKSIRFSASFISDSELENIEELSDEFKYLLQYAVNKEVRIGMWQRSISQKSSQKISIPTIEGNIVTLSKYVFTETTLGKIKFRPEFLSDDVKIVKQPKSIFKLKKLFKSNMSDIFNDLDKYQFEIFNYNTLLEEKILSMSTFPKSNVNDKEIPGFLDKLILAVKQPNDRELCDILKNELGDCISDFGHADIFIELFERDMRKWFLQKERSSLTNTSGLEFLNETKNKIVASGLRFVHQEKLENYGINFREENRELTAYLAPEKLCNVNRALNFVATEGTTTAAIEVYQTIKKAPRLGNKYDSMIIHFNYMLLPRTRKHVIDTFGMQDRYICLVVVSERCDGQEQALSTLYDDLLKIMMNDGCENKKLIFITKMELGLRNCSQIRCKLNFNDLTDESQKKLLDKPIVSLQGQKESMSFAELFRIRALENIDSNDLKNFRNAIDSRTLEKLIINGDNIKIGSPLESLDSIENYFIDRTFHRRVIIKATVLESLNTSDIYAVSHADQNNLRYLEMTGKTKRFQEIDSLERQVPGFVKLNRGEEKEHFEKLCNTYPNHNVHWLIAREKELSWVRSKGSITTLVDHRDTREKFSHDCEYDVCKTTTLDALVDELSSQDVGPVIVSDTAGMGKTTILTHFAKRIQEKNPKMWVVRINLNDFTHVLNMEKKSRNVKIGYNESAVEFLINHLLNLNAELERVILKELITKRGGVALLFDGFDEISPDYDDTVIAVLQAIKGYNAVKLVVTTRPHRQSLLEKTLQTFSHVLKPFSQEDQINFLVGFYRKFGGVAPETQLRIRAEAVLNKFATAIRSDGLNEFAGVPLQTRMIAEVFFRDSDDMVSVEPNVSDDVKIADLYRMFVDKKFEIYYQEKNKYDLSNPGTKEHIEDLKTKFLQEYRRLAMYTLLEEENSATWNLSRNEIENVTKLIAKISRGSRRTGIVTDVINQRAHFIHRTFMEYFVASYIFQHLGISEENDSTRQLETFILHEILRKSRYYVVRAFLNDLLSNPPVNSTPDPLPWEVKKTDIVDNETSFNIFETAVNESNYKLMKFFFTRLVKNVSNSQEWINIKLRKRRTKETLMHMVIQENRYKTYPNSSDANILEVVEWLLKQKADVNATDRDGNTPMHRAALTGQLVILKLLAGQRDADVTARCCERKTLQHMAAASGNLEMLKWLVDEQGCDVKAKTIWGQILQYVAAENDNLEMLKWLVNEQGCDVEARDDSGITLQYIAAENKNLEMLKWLVDEQGCDVKARTGWGETLQHVAAKYHNLEMMKWLVNEQGCDVKAETYSGKTLQHVAAKYHHLEMMKWLVDEQGCDVKAKTDSGKTLQYVAAENDNLEMLKWLVDEQGCDVKAKTDSGKTLQYVAAENDNLEMLKWLVDEQGCDVKARTGWGETLQYVAAENDNLEMLKWLVDEQGCDVKAKTDSGRTLQYVAAENDNLEMLKWLVDAQGCDVKAKTDSGRTLQYVAAKNDNLEMMKWLVDERGCDVKARTGWGETLQNVAAKNDNLEMLKWLVNEQGCDVKARTGWGETLQYVAAENDNLEMLKWLVNEQGCDVEAKDDSGITLQYVAAKNDNLEMLKWLVNEQGCDVKARTGRGETLQYVAAERKNLEMLKWLVNEQGCDVKAKTDSGLTLPYVAAQTNNLEMLKWLVDEQGCDVKAKTGSRMTLQYVAAKHDNLEMLKWLVNEQGCDVEAITDLGTTLQCIAAANGNLEMMKWLVDERGCDVKAKDDSGITLQHVAAENDNLEMLKWLVDERGCDVKARTDWGTTLQYVAADNDNLKMLKWLVDERGCDVKAKDDSGTSLLQVAIESGNWEVEKWLAEGKEAMITS
ncbi:uncharacterized protein LOC107220356 isoform X2 [Neodiprion lecontei]|uniref:Uncharacterized protein LOC107220356 isoform X2 n=1 Tax=Neodiprion lecontei TaxID=441921 RepID=A0ABM3G4T3_NEOLC|nr:uncharacterized protein LOC107220356 isoform X2 [Neodiprion lecontei]